MQVAASCQAAAKHTVQSAKYYSICVKMIYLREDKQAKIMRWVCSLVTQAVASGVS